MKKLILLTSLLAIPLCRAAAADDTNYYRKAREAIMYSKWQDLYALIDEGEVGVNEDGGGFSPFLIWP